MKVIALILPPMLVTATPAVVWNRQSSESSSVLHHSEGTRTQDLLSGVFNGPADDSSLVAAIFLLGRHPDGRDSLSVMASSGDLPGIASNYESAHSMYHNVWGVDGVSSMFRDVRDGLSSKNPRVVQYSLSEFNRKLSNSRGQFSEALEDDSILGTDGESRKPDVVLVDVAAGTDASEIDKSVVRAIKHSSINSVVLTGIRGSAEVKDSRNVHTLHRVSGTKSMSRSFSMAGHRRLEEQGDAVDDDAANQEDDDLAGVYYVHMTPNIFAGILFGLFFAFVSFIGVSCMGMISTSDVYVSKVPSVGREA